MKYVPAGRFSILTVTSSCYMKLSQFLISDQHFLIMFDVKHVCDIVYIGLKFFFYTNGEALHISEEDQLLSLSVWFAS